MAKLSKERYLVLSVDDSAEGTLKIQLALSPQQRNGFVGSFANGESIVPNLVEEVHWGPNKLSLRDMAQLDALMSQKASEVTEWLQNQPFEDVVVVVLPTVGQDENCVRIMPQSTSVVPLPDGSRSSASLDLVNLLEQYFERRS